MKCLKKIIALAIVATMVMGLCAINVSAADFTGLNVVFKNAKGDVITSAKAGTTITAEVTLPNGTYQNAAIAFMPNKDAGIELTNEDMHKTDGISYNTFQVDAYTGSATAIATSSFTIDDAPYFTIDITIPATATEGSLKLLEVDEDAGCFVTTDKMYDIPVASYSITVLDGFTADHAKAATINPLAFGIDEDDAEAALMNTEITVYNDNETKSEKFKPDSVEIEDFVRFAPGEYDVTFTIDKESFTDDTVAASEVDITCEATVVVEQGKASNGLLETDAEDLLYIVQDEGTADEDQIAGDFFAKGYYGTLVFTNGYEEEVRVVAASVSNSLDLTEISDLEEPTNVATITLGIVLLDGTALVNDYSGSQTVLAYVVPAEIKGCNFKVTGTGNTAKPVIDVELSEGFGPVIGDEVVATIYDDEFEPVKTITKEIMLGSSVFETGKIKLESDKMLKEMGFTVGDTFYVGVDYNGAALVLPIPGAVEAYTPYKECKVLARTPGGGGTGGFTPGTDVDAKEYSVNIGETENGKVVASATRAAEGTVVTVTATPDEGYYLADVTVYDAAENEIAVVDNAFTMPANSVIVYATFAEGEEPITPPVDSYEFADVPTTHWAYEYIGALKALGIVGGVDEEGKYYEPESNVTRAEFTKMIVGILGLDVNPNATVDFTDAKNDWYTPYIAAAVEAGIVNGVSDTEFAPNAAISRQDACTILGRIFIGVDAPEFDILKWNDSAKIADYAKQYVQVLAALEIVNGYGDNTFRPTENITRAEAAKVIYLSMAELAIESAEEEVEAAVAEELGIEAE